MRRSFLAAALLAFGLAGCATRPAERSADQLALYLAHAGPPVNDFLYPHTFTQWTPLGSDALAVWLSPSRAFLLDVSHCSDLEWAHGIQLTQNGGTVSARFDRVLPLGVGQSVPCRIEQIRPLDIRAIRDAERSARAAR